MKKYIILTVVALVAIATTGCGSTKMTNTITWEEAEEISWESYLKVYNHPNVAWEEQSEEVQNYYLDCWAGSAQEDSVLQAYHIVY